MASAPGVSVTTSKRALASTTSIGPVATHVVECRRDLVRNRDASPRESKDDSVGAGEVGKDRSQPLSGIGPIVEACGRISARHGLTSCSQQ